MRIDYDASLVEEVVFAEVRALEAAGEGALARRYFRELERIYDRPAGDPRDAAARDHHRRWFARLGLDRPVAAAAIEVGPAFGRADRVFVHGVVSEREEGADLFGRAPENGEGEERTIVVRLRPSRYRDREGLARFLRHEFRIVADLLDPSFGARREALEAVGPGRERLVRDRYRLLWGITADGRIRRAGLQGLRAEDEWKAAFEKGFAFLPESVRRETFERLHDGPRPSHATLLALASDPRSVLVGESDAPSPGSRCPLCGFPTFAWEGEPCLLPPAVLSRIRSSFTNWGPDRGLCRECADRYRLAVSR